MRSAQPVRSPAQVALAFHLPGVLWQVSDFTRRWGFESQSVCTLYLHTGKARMADGHDRTATLERPQGDHSLPPRPLRTISPSPAAGGA